MVRFDQPRRATTSLYIAMAIMASSKDMPTYCRRSSHTPVTGLPVTASQRYYIRCPPSRTGTGSRFRMPRLTLMKAKKPR